MLTTTLMLLHLGNAVPIDFQDIITARQEDIYNAFAARPVGNVEPDDIDIISELSCELGPVVNDQWVFASCTFPTSCGEDITMNASVLTEGSVNVNESVFITGIAQYCPTMLTYEALSSPWGEEGLRLGRLN